MAVLKKLIRRILGRTEGFTLVEMVVSIAALSLISVFILNMFIISSQLQHEAADIDKATLMAAQTCEKLRVAPEPELTYGDIIAGSVVSVESNGALRFTVSYDENWNVTHNSDNAKFVMTAWLGPILSESRILASFGRLNDSTDIVSQRLSIEVEVISPASEDGGEPTELCKLATSRTHVRQEVRK